MPRTGIEDLQERDRLLPNTAFRFADGCHGISSEERETLPMGHGRGSNMMQTRLHGPSRLDEVKEQEEQDGEEVEKSLLKKVDRRMSVLVLIYILNYVDRNNISVARLKGFEQDLHLKGSQFATLLSVLYVGYTIMQVPSNMFLHHLGKPSKYIPGCMVVWGVLSFLTGLTRNFYGAVITRFLLGFVEAAFFPGALFLISKWYTQTELSQRTAYLASGNLISNAFGSLVASGVLDGLDGFGGLAGWRWLFFVEGALTVVIALWSMSILPDFPESKSTSSWLTPAERKLALRRMAEDTIREQRDETSPLDSTSTNSSRSPLRLRLGNRWPGLYLALIDPKVWWLALTLTVMIMSLSFNAYFPTIVGTLATELGLAEHGHRHEHGSNMKVVLLLCVPPWVWATGVAVLVNRYSDRNGERCRYIVSSLFVGLVGFILAMSTMIVTVRYFSLFLMTQSYTGFICFLAWASSSVSQPPAKRAVALALVNCVAQLGNIMGSYVWPLSWGPSYKVSFAISACMSALAIVMCLCFRAHLAFLNRFAENAYGDLGDREAEIELPFGDGGEGEMARGFSRSFRYML